MTTRIRYTKVGLRYFSNEFVAYDGRRFQIEIHPVKANKKHFTVAILNNLNVVNLHVNIRTLPEAKRKARRMLVEIYNVRLNEEIRPRYK